MVTNYANYCVNLQVWGSDDETDESSDGETSKRNREENEREEAEIDAVYEFMASQRSNGHSMHEQSSDEDFSEIDEESNEGKYPVDCKNYKGFRFIALCCTFML